MGWLEHSRRGVDQDLQEETIERVSNELPVSQVAKFWNMLNHIRYLSSGNQATIYVGPENKAFIVNEDLLCDRLKFFKVAFQGAFKEGQTKSMTLPDDEREIFSIFVDWLYGLPLRCEHPQTHVPGDEAAGEWSMTWHNDFDHQHELHWCKIFVLGDKLDAIGLTKTAICMLEGCLGRVDPNAGRHHISPMTVQYVLENTITESLLQQTVIKQIISAYFTGQNDKEFFEKYLAGNEELQVEVFGQIREHMDTPHCGIRFNHCFYHHKILSNNYYSKGTKWVPLDGKCTYPDDDPWASRNVGD